MLLHHRCVVSFCDLMFAGYADLALKLVKQ